MLVRSFVFLTMLKLFSSKSVFMTHSVFYYISLLSVSNLFHRIKQNTGRSIIFIQYDIISKKTCKVFMKLC